MKKRMNKMILMGGLSLLVLAGCQKGLFDDKGGREVSFTATSGVSTKAAYESNPGEQAAKQRIDWEAGDELVIFSDKAKTPQGKQFAYYTITDGTIEADGVKSKAKLTKDAEAMLRYDEVIKGKYNFVGVYPSLGTIANGKVTVNANILSEQSVTDNGFPSMENALLLSVPVGADWYSPVSLEFNPAFTTLEFTLAAEKSMKLTGFHVVSESSALSGEYGYEADLTVEEPAWTAPSVSDEAGKAIDVVFPTPLDMTLSDGETLTNSIKFGFYTFPVDVTGLTFTFDVQFEEDGETVNATRKLTVKYAKDGDGYNQGDFVKFAGGKKHNISGIVIPAKISDEVVIDLAVIPWDDPETDAIEYGPDAVVNALALEFASGAAKTDGGSRRRNNNFADDTHPINAYFSVFSPDDAQWKIKVTGDTDKLLVTADDATSTSTDDGLELTGAVGGRVHFKVDRAAGATITDATQIQLNFYVVVDGREISINSEITRANALTITGKVGN